MSNSEEAAADKHVHDCSGPDKTCPCGYKLVIPRFIFTVEVWDNKFKMAQINDNGMSDDRHVLIAVLARAIRKLEATR